MLGAGQSGETVGYFAKRQIKTEILSEPEIKFAEGVQTNTESMIYEATFMQRTTYTNRRSENESFQLVQLVPISCTMYGACTM